MEHTDYLVRSFHPDFVDIKWLEERYELYCVTKHDLEVTTTLKRLQHAPSHPKVVHKIFGRDSSTSKILLFHNEKTYEEYMNLITRKTKQTSYTDFKDRVAHASVQTGVLSDSKSLVQSLRSDRQRYVDVLTLYELIHMTYFCKDEYTLNTHPQRQWIIDYLCELVKNVNSQTCDFRFSVDCQGLQTESLIKEVRSILLSSFTPVIHPRCITVISDAKMGPTPLDVHTPISSSYDAHHTKIKGRTIIGRNETRHSLPTTYNSPISSTIASPIPDTLLPAWTGSMLTRMEDTDL